MVTSPNPDQYPYQRGDPFYEAARLRVGVQESDTHKVREILWALDATFKDIRAPDMSLEILTERSNTAARSASNMIEAVINNRPLIQ